MIVTKTPTSSKGILLHPVKSTQIKEIGYSPESKTLVVTFLSGAGKAYHYADVTQAEYDAFKGAQSVGSHFGKHIKQRSFVKV